MSKDFVSLSEPFIKSNAWQYVKDCLDTGWVSSAGQYVERFEQSVKSYIGRDYAVACANGTAALHTALLVAGIGHGDEVAVPALTFIAPANAIKYVGAFPVFIDVEPRHGQMDPQKLNDFFLKDCEYIQGSLINKHTRRCVKAILPVDLLGHPCDMDIIISIARKFKLLVIEDAAESLGAAYKHRRVGSQADISCLSFNGNKIITTGGGGMLLTDDAQWAKKASYLTTQAKDDALEYIHHEIGYNYRLTNVQAAIGLAQMECLDEYVAIKRGLAKTYTQALGDVAGLSQLQEAPWAHSTFWLYTLLIDKDLFGQDSRQLMCRLKSKNIQSRPLWQPIIYQKPYADCFAYHIEQADRLYEKALCIPSSVGLIESQQQRVIEAIKGEA